MNNQKIKIYNRQAYNNSIKRLEKLNAPSYIIEAYKQGHADVVNNYYKRRLANRLGFISRPIITEEKVKEAKKSKVNFINEAARKQDKEFIDELFRMSNMDIMTGKRLPPNSGELILQGSIGDSDYGKHLKRRKK